MGATTEQLAKLHDPTPESEIKQRPAPGRSGKQLDYIDARYVMDTLDKVVGPAFWQDEYRTVVEGGSTQTGVVCRLSINVDGEGWLAKEDVGTESNIEGTKGSYSDAFKRAAVKWGIGRDLYDEDRARRSATASRSRSVTMPPRRHASRPPRPRAVGLAPSHSPSRLTPTMRHGSARHTRRSWRGLLASAQPVASTTPSTPAPRDATVRSVRLVA